MALVEAAMLFERQGQRVGAGPDKGFLVVANAESINLVLVRPPKLLARDYQMSFAVSRGCGWRWGAVSELPVGNIGVEVVAPLRGCLFLWLVA